MTELSPGKALELFRTMTLMHRVDDKVRTLIATGQAPMQYFSPRGQEGVAAGVSVALRPEDYVVTTYRGIFDAIGKGVPIDLLFAEYFGKVTGPCKGKGGPMHLTHVESGLMVTTGIVGSGLPIANGLALSSVLREDGRVTVVHFGDGASNIGAFHEALNLASVWDLPVVFVCTNNRYAENTSFEFTSRNEQVSDRAAAYGMPGITVDGNDPVAVLRAAEQAVERARSGGGPSLVEATAFRFFGHYFGDDQKYLKDGELAAAMAHDPMPLYRQRMLDNGWAEEASLSSVEQDVDAAIESGLRDALAAPAPSTDEIYRDVLASV
jgi:pyruvate dehydrogenase E1 component alpha subunit